MAIYNEQIIFHRSRRHRSRRHRRRQRSVIVVVIVIVVIVVIVVVVVVSWHIITIVCRGKLAMLIMLYGNTIVQTT